MIEFSPAEAETLIEQHRQELFIFLVRRVACSETANDLLQDTFFRLINARTAQPIQNPRAFVYRIAANLATDHLRRQKSDNVDLTDIEVTTIADETATPEQHLMSRQQLDLCEEALDQLSPLCLKIFALSRFEGYTHQQIAEELGISVSWVEKNIIRALKQCKLAINRPDLI